MVSDNGEDLDPADLILFTYGVRFVGARLWGETYERPHTELLHVEDAIASEIAVRLRPRLSGQEVRSLGRHGTADPQAHELYMRAQFFLRQETEDDDLEARRLYLQALERDPRFVEAHVGVSVTYARSAASGWVRPAEAWPRAADALRKALDLDPGNVLARCLLANRRFLGEWDWAGAERDLSAWLGITARPASPTLTGNRASVS